MKDMMPKSWEAVEKQNEILKKFCKMAGESGNYGIAILDECKTGATTAITNFNEVEVIAEMLASFTIQYAANNDIPFEDFLDIYVGYYEKFQHKVESGNVGGRGMNPEIERQVQTIRKMLKAYNGLKSIENTEVARGKIEEAIVKAARELAEIFDAEDLSNEKYADSFFEDLKIICNAYDAVSTLIYKSDWSLENKNLAVLSAMEEFILAMAEKLVADENDA